MVWRSSIPSPTKRLLQGLVGIGFLPAVEKSEFVGQPRLNRQVLLADRLLGPEPVTYGEVEISADDDCLALGDSTDHVQELVDQIRVASSSRWRVNAERQDGVAKAGLPRRPADFGAEIPSVSPS